MSEPGYARIESEILTGEDDVEDVLDGVGDEVAAATSKTCTLEHVDNVVPVDPKVSSRYDQ